MLFQSKEDFFTLFLGKYKHLDDSMTIHASCWLGPVRKNPCSAFWFPECLSWQPTRRMRTGLNHCSLDQSLDSVTSFLSRSLGDSSSLPEPQFSHPEDGDEGWLTRVKDYKTEVYRRALQSFSKCEGTDKCWIATNTRFSMRGPSCPHMLKSCP